ncbi:MAG: T9SS type A sorting domain-containing protein [Bacteroidetes bacterium]|nr:T9SS type A sorting domain-containing protein [Bacteroidota bacterium]
MKYKKLKLSTIFLLCLGLTGLQAQESINTTGGNASGSGGSASYSVGQVVYTTNTGTNGLVAQGVQQPFEIMVVTGLEAAKGINLMVSAYPNPTTDFLNLKVDASATLSIQSMLYQLFDINGKLLESKILTSNKTTITMDNRVASIYFLKVLDNNKEVKIFKIIKN